VSDQYRVHLGVTPAIKKPNYYLWVLSRDTVASLLINNVSLRGGWKLATSNTREASIGRFHPTARARTATPAPIREFLRVVDDRKCRGRVLYHGVGRDDAGTYAMSREGRDEVHAYDPYHPIPTYCVMPGWSYDEVFSIYTLNVVTPKVGIDILGEIYDSLKPSGKAVIAVRRDL